MLAETVCGCNVSGWTISLAVRMNEETNLVSKPTAPRFASWRSYWLFRREVTRSARYVHSQVATKFLEAVALSAETRAKIVKKGQQFYRAQVAHHDRLIEEIDDTMPAPALPERMLPLADRATEGRVNPKGIPCLYMASTQEAAIAEARPWIGSLVSVAQLEILRDQRIVDCTNIGSTSGIYLFGEPPLAEWEDIVWKDIAMAFREPVTRNDDLAEYAPTQILAELFRSHGFDGVAYRSAFGTDRYNIALFDLNAAELNTCSLHEIIDVDLKYKESDNPYYVHKDKSGQVTLIRNVIIGTSPVNK
jgi:hypothetical protein